MLRHDVSYSFLFFLVISFSILLFPFSRHVSITSAEFYYYSTSSLILFIIRYTLFLTFFIKHTCFFFITFCLLWSLTPFNVNYCLLTVSCRGYPYAGFITIALGVFVKMYFLSVLSNTFFFCHFLAHISGYVFFIFFHSLFFIFNLFFYSI